jgi:acyl-CoA reductase-like NAD-dependent aldehyde dehydrogenase
MTLTDRLRSSNSATPAAGQDRPALGEFPCLVAGEPSHTAETTEVRSPFDGALAAVVHRAGPAEIERAIAAAAAAFETTRRLPSWKRAEVLERVSAAIAARQENLARIVALEAGKPLKTARLEVARAAFTFKVAGEEARRVYGEIVPLDWLPGTERHEGHVRRVPLGPIAGISPFNFPLNLVAHKLAPAIAAGNPIILRPASQTPISALELGRLVLEAGWPAEAISVVPSATDAAAPLIEDDRIRLLTFTGSPAVGWSLKGRAGRKRVTLELGGNAAVIVHDDADLDFAADRIVWGGFSYAGQSCISAQRIYVAEAIYDQFVERLMPRVGNLSVGDPLDEATDVGPLIDAAAADRVDEWVREATAAGARVLCGGSREGTIWQPTVLDSVRPDLRVSCAEVFAPLIVLNRYSDVRQAIEAADNSDYGLQAGLFTNDQRVIAAAIDELDVGGLIVNDVSAFRVDHMPYGGVKLSGFGREGLRYAIEEMTEMKLVVFNGNTRL